MSILKGEDRRYNNANDAWMRLGNTFVKFDEQIFYTLEIENDQTITAYDPARPGSEIKFNANDSRLDLTSLKLGFINREGTTKPTYLARTPVRQQKQGVDLERLRMFCIDKAAPASCSVNKTFQIGVMKLFSNEFPRLMEIESSTAFSKTWAVRTTSDKAIKGVFHRTTPVGVFIEKEKLFIFPEGSLTELRRKSLLNVLAKQGKGDFNVLEHKSS